MEKIEERKTGKRGNGLFATVELRRGVILQEFPIAVSDDDKIVHSKCEELNQRQAWSIVEKLLEAGKDLPKTLSVNSVFLGPLFWEDWDDKVVRRLCKKHQVSE